MKCYYHEEKNAVSYCSECSKALCKVCYDLDNNGICQNCKNNSYAKAVTKNRKSFNDEIINKINHRKQYIKYTLILGLLFLIIGLVLMNTPSVNKYVVSFSNMFYYMEENIDTDLIESEVALDDSIFLAFKIVLSMLAFYIGYCYASAFWLTRLLCRKIGLNTPRTIFRILGLLLILIIYGATLFAALYISIPLFLIFIILNIIDKGKVKENIA